MNFIIPYKHKTRNHKTPRRKHSMLFDIGFNNIFLDMSQARETKAKKGGLHQTNKFLYREGNYQQNEKSVY